MPRVPATRSDSEREEKVNAKQILVSLLACSHGVCSLNQEVSDIVSRKNMFTDRHHGLKKNMKM